MSGHEEDIVATKAWDSAIVRRLAKYARPHVRLFAVSFVILIGMFALQLAGPWIIKLAIDGPVRMAEEARIQAGGAEVDVSPFLREVGWLAALYVAVIAIGACFRYGEISQLTRTGQAVIHDLRTELFGHMQELELAWFDQRPTGSLVTRVTSDVENLNELFTSGLIVLLFDLIKVIIVLVLLFGVSPSLALLVLLLTPILIGVSLVFRGGARRAHRKVRARLARLNGFLQEVLSGIRVVQVFRREKRVSDQFRDHLSEYLSANIRTIFLFAIFYPILGFVTILIQGSTVWAGGGAIASGAITAGDFILFWFLLQYLVGPIRELGERYNVLQAALASAERIFDILDTAPVVAQGPKPIEVAPTFRGKLSFENVSFSYPGAKDELVIKNLSFEILAGQTVALVGATGSGKSTLVSLALRFFDPNEGRITVDGTDLRELDLESYRRRLGIVLQEDFLFTGTVRHNLELGRDWVTPESLALALETSTANELIARLPQGLETEVAERGTSLSTGERELLSIARALAGNPSLVILDEATSSVDSTTEARIEEATNNLLRDRSALVVAHRLSTIRRADRILVLHHGELRESGRHEELLAAGGIYARLYALQFRDDAAEAS